VLHLRYVLILETLLQSRPACMPAPRFSAADHPLSAYTFAESSPHNGIGASVDMGWLVMMTFVTDPPRRVPLYESGIKGDFQYLRRESPLPPFSKEGNLEAS
jgi:hypothetical protein